VSAARYGAPVIPWLIFAVVAVPLLVIAFAAARRKTISGERPVDDDAQSQAKLEQEFAAAEAYEEQWREQDRKSFHEERLP
jgi:hypothetical protein